MDVGPTYQSRSEFFIKGYGHMLTVALDREDNGDFAFLVGQLVTIDGTLYRCLGVERFAHGAPWRVGERIGLLVEPA